MEFTLYVVGIGPGTPAYILPAALERIRSARVLVGSQRALDDYSQEGQKVFPVTGKLSALQEFIEKELALSDVVVMVSGDTGYYSLLPYLKRTFGSTTKIEVIPGISSVQLAFARMGEVWQDATLVSFHGRIVGEDKLGYTQGKKMAFLTDKEYTPAKIASVLLDHGWPQTAKLTAFERLGYEDENRADGNLQEMTTLVGFSHAVVVVVG